jgi:hypothetical protein
MQLIDLYMRLALLAPFAVVGLGIWIGIGIWRLGTIWQTTFKKPPALR